MEAAVAPMAQGIVRRGVRVREGQVAQQQRQEQQDALKALQYVQEVVQASEDPDLLEVSDLLELTEAAIQDGHPGAIKAALELRDKSSQSVRKAGVSPSGMVLRGWGDLTAEKEGIPKQLSQAASVIDIASIVTELPRLLNWTARRSLPLLKQAGPAILRWGAKKAALAGAGTFFGPVGTVAAPAASLGWDAYKLAKWVKRSWKARGSPRPVDPARARYLASRVTQNAQRLSNQVGRPLEIIGGTLHTAAGFGSGDPWETGLGVAQTVVPGSTYAMPRFMRWLGQGAKVAESDAPAKLVRTGRAKQPQVESVPSAAGEPSLDPRQVKWLKKNKGRLLLGGEREGLSPEQINQITVEAFGGNERAQQIVAALYEGGASSIGKGAKPVTQAGKTAPSLQQIPEGRSKAGKLFWQSVAAETPPDKVKLLKRRRSQGRLKPADRAYLARFAEEATDAPQAVKVDAPGTGTLDRLDLDQVFRPASTPPMSAEEFTRLQKGTRLSLRDRVALDAQIAQGDDVTSSALKEGEVSAQRMTGGPRGFPRQVSTERSNQTDAGYSLWHQRIKDDLPIWKAGLEGRGYEEADIERFLSSTYALHAGKYADPQKAKTVFIKWLGDQRKLLDSRAARMADPSKYMMQQLRKNPAKFERIMGQVRSRMEKIMGNIRVMSPEYRAQSGAVKKFPTPEAYQDLPHTYEPRATKRILDQLLAPATGAKPFKDPTANLMFRMVYLAEDLADSRLQMRMLSGINPKLVEFNGYNPRKFTPRTAAHPLGLNELLPSTPGEPKNIAALGEQIQRQVEDMLGARMKQLVFQPGRAETGMRTGALTRPEAVKGSTGAGTIPTRRGRFYFEGQQVPHSKAYLTDQPFTELPDLSPKTIQALEAQVEESLKLYAHLNAATQNVNDGAISIYMLGGLDPDVIAKLGVKAITSPLGGIFGFQAGEEWGKEKGYGPAGQRATGLFGTGVGAATGFMAPTLLKGVFKRGAPLPVKLQSLIRYDLLTNPASPFKAILGAHSGGYLQGLERLLQGTSELVTATTRGMFGRKNPALRRKAHTHLAQGQGIIKGVNQLEKDFFTNPNSSMAQAFSIDPSTSEGMAALTNRLAAAGIDETADAYLAHERIGGSFTNNWLGKAFRMGDVPIIEVLMKHGVDFEDARRTTLTGRMRTKTGQAVYDWLGGNRAAVLESTVQSLRKQPNQTPAVKAQIRDIQEQLPAKRWVDLAATTVSPIVRVGLHGAEQGLRYTAAPAMRLLGSKAKWLDDLAPQGDVHGNIARLGLGAGSTGVGAFMGAHGDPRIEDMGLAALGPLMVPGALGYGMGQAYRKGGDFLEGLASGATSVWDQIQPASPELFDPETAASPLLQRYTPGGGFLKFIARGLDPWERSTSKQDFADLVASGEMSQERANWMRPLAPMLKNIPFVRTQLPRRTPTIASDPGTGMPALPSTLTPWNAMNPPGAGPIMQPDPQAGAVQSIERLRELQEHPSRHDYPSREPLPLQDLPGPVGEALGRGVRAATEQVGQLPEGIRAAGDMAYQMIQRSFAPGVPESRTMGAGRDEVMQLLAKAGMLDPEGEQIAGLPLGTEQPPSVTGKVTTDRTLAHFPHTQEPDPRGTRAPLTGMTPKLEEIVRVGSKAHYAEMYRRLRLMSQENPALFHAMKNDPTGLMMRRWIADTKAAVKEQLQRFAPNVVPLTTPEGQVDALLEQGAKLPPGPPLLRTGPR